MDPTVTFLERCPLCESSALVPYALDAWEPMRLHVAQSRCTGYGLLVSQPQASREDADRYYRAVHFEEISFPRNTPRSRNGARSIA